MQKVLYIGGFEMPDGNAAAQRVLGVAKVMHECGYEVRFLGLSRKITEPQNGIMDGFTYTNLVYPKSPISWFKYLTGRDHSITEIQKYKPDLIVLYNHPALAIEHIAKHCKKNNIKVIADVTEWYEAGGNPVFKAIKGYDSNRRMQKSHLKLDGLICISAFLNCYYQSKGVKTIEVPPLVDISQSKWLQTSGAQKNEIQLVYAGSPGAVKDRLDVIIKALNQAVMTSSNQIKFDVIGLTKEQFIEKYSYETIPEFVMFHGRIPHTEVIKRLLAADFQVFVRPDNLTNRAGFPTKFVETITSKSLPITNLNSNLSDYLVNGYNGFLIDDKNEQSIVESISVPLSKTKSEIDRLKANIDNNTFDYHNYVLPFKLFLSQL